jgi:cell filamentation protein
MDKIFIKLYKNQDVRAIWNEEDSKWYFSVIDLISNLNDQSNYTKSSNYWRWLKRKLIAEKVQFVSDTHRLRLPSQDGKKYLTDTIDSEGIIALAKQLPNNKSVEFLEWFIFSDHTIDGQSKKKAYSLWESNLINDEEVGTVKALQKIHGYIFGGLYDFAGKIRPLNISKNGFSFTSARFLLETLKKIEQMPENSIEAIIDKYVGMNLAHPFLEGNGRSTRIWLDSILKKNFQQCLDWSKIEKKEYLTSMQKSVVDSSSIKQLLFIALTEKIDDRELFLKGIDYSYYNEEEEDRTI